MEYTASDARLHRRLKRRIIFDQNFKHNNSAKLRKGTVDNDSRKDYSVTRDDDYQMDLDNLKKLGNPVDTHVPISMDDTNVNAECNADFKEDPDYMMFCKGLIEAGKSFILRVPTVDGELVIEYEREVLFDQHPVSHVKSNNTRKRIRAEDTQISWSSSSQRKTKIDKSYMKYMKCLVTSQKEHDNMLHTPCCTKLASDYDVGSCERAEKADKSSSSERGEAIHEPYMKLLNEFETGQKDCDDDSCDSEVIMFDFDPSASECHSPFMTSKPVVVAVDVETGSCLQSHCTYSSARFREELMKDLKKPYDQAEYESLLEEATCRTAILGQRVFRSGIKSYKQESIGKSYLDNHGDLAAKINKVRYDRGKVLNLLRGFFYWLKNLAHEGAFIPWLDPCCMEMLPPSK